MTTAILGNYAAERTADGLLIKNVEISRETTRKQRPDFLRDLDVGVFEQFIKHYDRRVAQGKVGAFVLLNHEGPGIGRIINLRIENKQLVGDLLITNEKAIEAIEKGELTERSIEWGWSTTDAKLKGVALLSGAFGQDSEGWRDLTVDYTAAMITKEFEDFSSFQVKTVALAHTLNTEKTEKVKTIKKEKNMSLTPEDLKAIGDLFDSKFDSKIDAKLDQRLGKAELDADPVNTNKVDEALQRIQKRERDITITGYVENLARKGYSNKAHLRKSFEKFGDNLMAMEVEFKRLMEKADEDVKLEMEEQYEKPSLDAELSEQFKAFKENYPDLKITESEFKMVCKGENKNPNLNYETAIEVL